MIRNKLETSSVENNSLMRVLCSLHSYWLQMTYSQAFWKQQKTPMSCRYIALKVKTGKEEKTPQNKTASNIKETRAGTIKFPIMQLELILFTGRHRWSPRRCVSVHACMCVILHVPFCAWAEVCVCVRVCVISAYVWWCLYMCTHIQTWTRQPMSLGPGHHLFIVAFFFQLQPDMSSFCLELWGYQLQPPPKSLTVFKGALRWFVCR